MYHFSKRSRKTTRRKIGKNDDSLALLMENILVSFGIDKARYYGGALESNYIQKLIQNSNEIFKQFLKQIMTIISNEKDYFNFR